MFPFKLPVVEDTFLGLWDAPGFKSHLLSSGEIFSFAGIGSVATEKTW